VFVQVELGQPLSIPDGAADLVIVFHSLHNMQDDALWRLRDICRTVAPGGLVFIKDHDVTSAVRASNVDFEHLVYQIMSRESTVETPSDTTADTLPQVDPMTYYARGEVIDVMTGEGFELLWSDIISPRTYIYGCVFRRRDATTRASASKNE
jgi:predicted methyltransferase